VLIAAIEGDPSLLNPNDIASVTVLKDASSSAIYGAGGFRGHPDTTKVLRRAVYADILSIMRSNRRPRAQDRINGYEYALMFDSAGLAWNNYAESRRISIRAAFFAAYLNEYAIVNANPSQPKVQYDGITYIMAIRIGISCCIKTIWVLSTRTCHVGGSERRHFTSPAAITGRTFVQVYSDNYHMYN